jgi:hypothetical protein
MSHLLEEYAKSLGVKIGKPILVDHFYPVTDNKYITIHCDNKIDSKHYEYFPIVIDLIKNILHQNGYAIYQTGGESDPKLNVDKHYLNLTYKQSINLIKNSSLHVGIDSLPIHIASIYDIPIVALYSHIYPNHARPFWSSEEKTILLDSDRGKNKPSYSYQESPKSIRSIKPEKIAQSILDLLKINEKINFNTQYIGNTFHVELIEVVPDFRAELADKDKIIYLRADLNFDEQNIAFWCASNKTTIITNQKINPLLLKTYAGNINHIYFKTIDLDNEYLETIKKYKINFTICVEDESSLNEIKNLFFDYKVEFDNWKQRAENTVKYNNFFLSKKVLLSQGQLFASESHYKLNKKLDMFNEVIYDDINFWKEAEHFLFYERTNAEQIQTQ